MDEKAPYRDRLPVMTGVFDAALQVGLAAALIYACSRILAPLIQVLLWSAILAVMLYPLHRRLRARIGERWSAWLIGLVGITIMLGATFLIVRSLGTTVYAVISELHDHKLVLPSAPTWLSDLPLVGQKLAEAWTLAVTNTPAALTRYEPILKKAATWLLSTARGLAGDEFSFVLSFAIAAILVLYGKGAAEFTRQVLARATGNPARSVELAALAVDTIRSVALGIVGVAVIQSLLLGIGFFAIGLPAAGLLTLATLLLCIVQVPVVILTLPVIAYVFATEATLPALVFSIWALAAGLSDNLLKPLLLGRGLSVPMPVILAGVIGGVIADGLLGLFVGPVVLATGYVLLVRWMSHHPVDERPTLDAMP